MSFDEYKLSRTAQRVLVYIAHSAGSPPHFGAFEPVFSAKVDRIELNAASNPSKATIWFPDRRWNDRQYFNPEIAKGDKLRIVISDTIVFEGFVVSYLSDFSGGNINKGSAYERNAIVAYDYLWLLSVTCPVFGQFARGPDDYTDFGTASQTAIADGFIFCGGRRAIFNRDKKPDMAPTDLTLDEIDYPLFACVDSAEFWTARDMIRYILAPGYNRASDYFPFGDPALLTGVSDSAFNTVLSHVVIDGLNVIEALELVVKSVGFSFRIDYEAAGPTLLFFKPGAASAYTRDTDNPTILHQLHAPAAGEDISTAVAAGRKMLWSMQLAEDISRLVNQPWGLGAPHLFEFTAELVPAWLDSDLTPDTSESNAHLFFTDAALQEETNPDRLDYVKNYYPKGSQFKRDVGRRWSLNESGRYSTEATYDRGIPFDFADVIEDKYIKGPDDHRVYAPFNRQLLPALTVDKESLNSIGIKIEISFDGGTTWQTVNASISSLSDECGIYIEEANLAEIVDRDEGTISGGTLDGVQLNFFTSLADDKLNSRVFKDGDWKTRVRVTASVQLDQRLLKQSDRSPISGSPFLHSQIYDFSGRYGLQKRTASSQFDGGDLAAWNKDDSEYFGLHLDSLRKSCEDTSVSGSFTLDRLWPGVFKVGDCIEHLTGRDFSLAASFGEKTIFPEIVKIIIMPDRQKQKLITRDLRFAEIFNI